MAIVQPLLQVSPQSDELTLNLHPKFHYRIGGLRSSPILLGTIRQDRCGAGEDRGDLYPSILAVLTVFLVSLAL
jgi:hypothetical protein